MAASSFGTSASASSTATITAATSLASSSSSSTAFGTASLVPVSVNPFTVYGEPVRGQVWRLPAASELASLPAGASGYGCLQAPESPLGVALANASDEANMACPPGFFCPYYDLEDSDTLPVYCPPTSDCAMMRLRTDLCLPQGRYEPMLCRAGFYCPNSSTIFPCPEGSYCSCPAGTILERHYGTFLIILLVDVLLAAALLLIRVRELRAAGQSPAAVLPLWLRSVLRSKAVTAAAAATDSAGGPSTAGAFKAAGGSDDSETKDADSSSGGSTHVVVGDDVAVDDNSAGAGESPAERAFALRTAALVTAFRRGFADAAVSEVRTDFSFIDLAAAADGQDGAGGRQRRDNGRAHDGYHGAVWGWQL
ncbi:hypothetical protein HK405_015300, partial [Cladochytrium tenue]